MPKITVTETEVVSKKRKKVFTTSDGKSFTKLDKAEMHQYFLDFEEIRSIEVPTECRLSEVAAWANDLIERYGSRARFCHDPLVWGEASYMVVRKRGKK